MGGEMDMVMVVVVGGADLLLPLEHTAFPAF